MTRADDPPTTLVPTQCGICDHDHMPGIDCPCGCTHYRPHPNVVEDIRDLAEREREDYPAGSVLAAADAIGLLESLNGLERQYEVECGWGLPSALFALTMGRDANFYEVMVNRLDLPVAFWHRPGADPSEVLYALSRKVCEHRPVFHLLLDHGGIARDSPIVAWMFYSEMMLARRRTVAGQAKPAEDPVDDIRGLTAVDVDGRHYSVQRLRTKQTRHMSVEPPGDYASRVAHVRGGAVPRVNEALAMLARVSTEELWAAKLMEQPPT